jgi:hypothetical protein
MQKFSNEVILKPLLAGCSKDIVTFMGPCSCLLRRMSSTYIDWELFDVIYRICKIAYISRVIVISVSFKVCNIRFVTSDKWVHYLWKP